MSNKKVFISYAHDSVYSEAVKYLAVALRDKGFEVFLDSDYIDKGDWAELIDDHIDMADYFLFTVSSGSVDKERYCIKELTRAGQNKKPIIPIILDPNIFLPTAINNLHCYFLNNCLNPDFSVNEVKFNDFLNTLTKAMDGEFVKKYADGDRKLFTCLNPINNEDKLYYLYEDFCGRDDMFKNVEAFIENHNKHILLIEAGPGSGKSAFSAALAWRYTQTVAAIHFCQYNNIDRINPRNIICSIIYQLAQNIKEYKNKLLNLVDLEEAVKKSPARIFEYLLIDQIRDLDIKENKLIIIDALDEATLRNDNEVATLLYQSATYLPSWLSILVTSRKEKEVTGKIESISQIYSFSSKSTENDLKDYYIKQFPEVTPGQLKILVSKSDGTFLYAKEICKQIKENGSSLANLDFLPTGIYGYFFSCFKRLYEGESCKISYDTVKPLLELLCVSGETISLEFLEKYLNLDEYELNAILNSISSLFPVQNGNIEPIHKSLMDWLSNIEEAGNYYISLKIGREHLLNYIKNEYSKHHYKDIFVYKHYLELLFQSKGDDKIDFIKETLNNLEYIEKMIDYMPFDQGLNTYVISLNKLFKEDESALLEIFNNATFQSIFSKYRRLFYNAGTFKELRKIGLDKIVVKKDSNWGFEGEIGKAFYFYITEQFSLAINKCDQVLKNKLKLFNKPNYVAEIANIKGLSLRKLVEFDKAIAAHDLAIKSSLKAIKKKDFDGGDPEFELSLAHLIKAKILLRRGKSKESNECVVKAIETLQNEIDHMKPSMERTSNLLFLAEDKRVAADGYIWQKDYANAIKMLEECNNIYIENGSTTDRYYVRYRYTSCLLKIVKNGDYKEIKDELNAITDLIKDKYNLGIVSYYAGLNEFLNAKENIDEAFDLAKKAYDAFDSIDSYLEKDVVSLLLDDILIAKNEKPHYLNYHNKDCENWVNYIRGLLNESR